MPNDIGKRRKVIVDKERRMEGKCNRMHPDIIRNVNEYPWIHVI